MLGILRSKSKKKINKHSKESISFIEKLKGSVSSENRTIINDGFIEQNVSIPVLCSNQRISEKNKIGNCKWELEVYKLGDYIKADLKNLNFSIDTYSHFYVKVVLYIRNIVDDNSVYREIPFHTYDVQHTSREFKLIKIAHLYGNKSLLKNDECIIGAYIILYEYNKENFIENIKIKRKEENAKAKNEFCEWTMDINKILQRKNLNIKCKIGNQKCDLRIKTLTVNNYSYLLDIHINNLNLSSDILFSKNISYIRKCSDYSYYNFGECNPIDGITFQIDVAANSPNYIFENNKFVLGICHQYIYNFKEKFINKVKKCVKNDNHIPEYEGFFEWKVENWNKLINERVSYSQFIVGNFNWGLEIYPQGINGTEESNKDRISIRLVNNDNDFNYSYICIKKVIYFRNYYNDYTCYRLKGDDLFSYYSTYNNASEYSNFSYTDLFTEKGQNNNLIIENNKCIIGIYICLYEKEPYVDKLISSINDENQSIQYDGFYEWKIEKWNYLFYEEYSPIFKIGNSRWKLVLYPKGENNSGIKGVVTVKLENLNTKNTDTSIYAKLIFFIRNLYNSSFTCKSLPSFVCYSKDNNCYG